MQMYPGGFEEDDNEDLAQEASHNAGMSGGDDADLEDPLLQMEEDQMIQNEAQLGG